MAVRNASLPAVGERPWLDGEELPPGLAWYARRGCWESGPGRVFHVVPCLEGDPEDWPPRVCCTACGKVFYRDRAKLQGYSARRPRWKDS